MWGHQQNAGFHGKCRRVLCCNCSNCGFDEVTAFSADNTNVNYGIQNSVFTNLKNKQKDLLQGNCHAHIVHNTVKHVVDQLTVDVENVVLKVYGFFPTSAKQRESLKAFFRLCDVDFQEILRHVTTRWLSLNPAITQLMQTWIALKSYFISLGGEVSQTTSSFVKAQWGLNWGKWRHCGGLLFPLQ